MPNTDSAKTGLESRLAELQARLATLTEELGGEAEKDWSERANQLEDSEIAEGEASLIKHEIASTERALERIEAGTYGECLNCGAPIAAGRLDARPEASLCIKCASEA